MADQSGALEPRSPNLNLSPEEQRLFAQVFSAADSDGIGVVTGDVALRFFPERTKLPSESLAEIWQIADTEDKGFLTPSGFYMVLRLIGYAQAGHVVSGDLAVKAGGPLPRLEGINSGVTPLSPLQSQASGGPVKVPPLTLDKVNQYAALFQQSGAQDGILGGVTAKQIFDRAQLPNDILVRIWNLADTEQRGALSIAEFIVAMHLLASYRSGAMRSLPRNLPAGLWDAAARRSSTQRPGSGGGTPVSAIPRQFSGPTTPRTSSPLAARPAYALPQSSTQPQTSGDWAVSPQEKAQCDIQFARLDTQGLGFVTGDQAVALFRNSRLSDEDLGQIWALVDTRSQGQLNAEEFAVAMHLIRNQLQKRGPIPASLPANLIPPSARQVTAVSAQTGVPQVAVPTSVPKPKSAADDLFGLDALSDSTPSQIPQSTGGSSATPAPKAPASPPPVAQQSNVFKPFMPSSTFGLSIASPQNTGSGSKSVPQALIKDNHDDLLGDTDPEISKRLTDETTELANLSNQVSTLTNQMQDVKVKRSTADGNLSSVAAQKKDFEARLAQLRTAYEQEAREVRSLEEKLTASQNDTKKVQADLAMVQHTHKNLQEQRQQLIQALESDQKENAALKERMREVNAEINQIKPQIEKVKSDARQQKGLVAINRKQLNTNEAERDRLKTELDGATREYEDSTKELEESSVALKERQVSPPSLPRSVSPAGSPASQSTNPFSRRQTADSSGRGVATSPLAETPGSTLNHSAFDSFFGTTFPAASSTSEHPAVSFGGPLAPESSENTTERAHSNAGGNEQADPHTPTQSSQQELPPSSQLPPPPPQSRQITSSSLPMKESLMAPASPSSSIGVAPPASRFGEGSGYNTPTRERQTSQAGTSTQAEPANPMSPLSQTREASIPVKSISKVEPTTVVTEAVKQNHTRDNTTFGSGTIPGSFPGDISPTLPSAASTSGSLADAMESTVVEDPFVATSTAKTTTAKDDFDSAFAGFESKGKSPVAPSAMENVTGLKSTEEFPPIQEFGGDSDSDSDSGKGFDDDFTAPGTAPDPTASKTSANEGTHPGVLRTISQTSTLPTPNAEPSPPKYDQAAPTKAKTRTGSNQFPAEYSGLLPPRDDPASPVDAIASPVQQTSASIGPLAPSNDVANPKLIHSNSKDAFDDFDNDFADLAEAQAVDEKNDDDLGSSRLADFAEEFNPTFDSPAPSKLTASSMFGTDSTFENFESSVSGPAQASAVPTADTIKPSDSDWDSMFANLDKAGDMPQNGISSMNDAADAAFGNAPASGAGDSLSAPSRPGLGRALSEGTDHDDPILKRLTAMGYPRDKSLSALEKFDYNLDKAADHLAQNS